jgi:hypothetical protein
MFHGQTLIIAPTLADQDMLPQTHAFVLETFRWRPVTAGGTSQLPDIDGDHILTNQIVNRSRSQSNERHHMGSVTILPHSTTHLTDLLNDRRIMLYPRAQR